MKYRILLSVLIMVFFVGISRFTLNIWAPTLAEFLIVNEPPIESDLIIIPSGTDDGDRIQHGVHLFKQGYSRRVLLSGSSYLWKETGIDLMKVYAMRLGVPEQALLVDNDSGSTVANAITAKEVAVKEGFRSVLIVTSPTHSRRVKMVFRKIFPPEIQVTVVSAPTRFDPGRWWKVPSMSREVFYEYFVFLYYAVFGY